MRRALIVAVVLGLLTGSLAAPVEAAKKKKKKPAPALQPVPVTLFFSNTSGGCSDDAYLMVLAEPTEGSNCGTLLSGPGNELLVRAGQAPDTIVYNAAEGVPFVLDATQKITGKIQVASHSGRAENPGSLGAGPTTLVAALTGTSGGEEKDLGTVEVSYVATPDKKVFEVAVEFEPPAELDKAEFTSLSISLYNRGFAALHGFYRAVAPASNLTIPTWQ